MLKRSLPLALMAAACILPGAAAGGTSRPTIGKPKASPAKPVTGKRFSVAFPVAHARSATFSVTLGAARVRHHDTFAHGIARTTLVVPEKSGRLHVKVTARSGAAGRTRQVSFSVRVPLPPPALSVQAATATEGTSGTTPLTFSVALSHATTKPVSVGYATADGTATAPADYTATSGRLAFSPGQTTQTITVSIVGGTAISPDKQFSIVLSSPVNATVATGTATGTIHTHNTPDTGSWQGATQEGNYVFFTMTSDGTLTQFRTNSITENCSGGGLYLQGAIDWGSQNEWPVDDNGMLAASYSGAGPPAQDGVDYTAETWKVTGTFTTTSVSGTISIDDQLSYQGTSYDCSGSVTFTASFKG